MKPTLGFLLSVLLLSPGCTLVLSQSLVYDYPVLRVREYHLWPADGARAGRSFQHRDIWFFLGGR